jgi:hypothetical protein
MLRSDIWWREWSTGKNCANPGQAVAVDATLDLLVKDGLLGSQGLAVVRVAFNESPHQNSRVKYAFTVRRLL